eukprot:TRINITY_DN1967_c0_g1_i6.p1 TRINITY_DN1967_c0_g1~~TRINITY_DN1967_c0_g1_i6.p1  ORF type:complete len:281 (+),score=42.18 TRINITY_DN1967_c0_g1_i6:695-1537(+)
MDGRAMDYCDPERVARREKRDAQRQEAVQQTDEKRRKEMLQRRLFQLEEAIKIYDERQRKVEEAREEVQNAINAVDLLAPEVVPAFVRTKGTDPCLLSLRDMYEKETEFEEDRHSAHDFNTEPPPPSPSLREWTSFRTMESLDLYVEAVRAEFVAEGRFADGKIRGIPIELVVHGVLVRLCTGLTFGRLGKLLSCQKSKLRKAVNTALPVVARVCKRNVALPETYEELCQHIPEMVKEKFPGAVLAGDCTYVYLYEPTNFAFAKEAFCSAKHRSQWAFWA